MLPAWIFAAVFSSPMLLTYKEFMVQNKIQCWMILPYDWMWKVYVTLIAIAVFIIPAFIITFCYTVIVVIIWKKTDFTFGNQKSKFDEKTRIVSQGSKYSNNQQKRVHWTENPSSSRGVLPKAKIKTIKMTLVIVLAFIFCWSPFFIFDLLFVYGNIVKTNDTIAISTFIQSLAPLNSAANPVVYILFNYKLCKGVFKKNSYNTAFASRGTAV
ncbi:hypothetical protein KUTeg_001915 [Tegillarca granosa]|uniref:G-protein coupled receptors family 1 profile domain-containing protein n=1 Tax=Tegillarca granosa TaxID=220873 RepID=A0ABQ9FSU2_TEGGR|nr:hypothetical protein KUTeg_001915 [Tegillarca granosa]